MRYYARLRAALLRRGIGVVVAAAAATVGLFALGATPASAASGFTVRLIPENPFLTLDISGASTAAGAPLIQWVNTGGSNQIFTFQPVGGNYEIINQNSGQCLFADGIVGDWIYQEPCNGSAAELWSTSLTPGSAYVYTIANPASGLYMDVNGASGSEGTNIIQWTYNGGYNQYFSATAV
jgi:Ricin-type beta-trefoil lectin domain-like